MRALIAFALASGIAAPASALAQPRGEVVLRPGEAVTYRFDDGGQQGAPVRGRAEWTPYAVHAARELSGVTPPDAPERYARAIGEGGGAPQAERPAAGQVRLRFFSIAGQHTLLVVDNGLDRPIAYRAVMTRGGQARPTDVCIVPDGRPAFEHWPHPIDQLRLSDFRFVILRPGQPITCS